MNMAKTNKFNSGVAGNKMTALDKAKVCRIVFFRALIILLVDIVVSSLFEFIKDDGNRHYVFHTDLQLPLTIAFGVLTVAAAVYLTVTFVKKIDTSAHYMTPLMVMASALYLFVTTVFFDQFAATPFLFYTMTVIVSVLFVVYYIYTNILYKK